MSESIRTYFSDARNLLVQFMADESNFERIAEAARILSDAIRTGNKIIACGNGGSMSDAMHFAEELTGRYRGDRQSLAAIAISDPAYLTCAANDYGYDQVFSRFISGMGKSGDVLVAISTSGSSENVIRAAEMARSMEMRVIGLTGKSGGNLALLCDIELRAPMSEYADHVQELHIKIIHALILEIERHIVR